MKKTPLNTRNQLLCVWAGPLFLCVYLVGFAGIAGYLPPHSPSLTAADVAVFYIDHANKIRGGHIICMTASTLLLPWFAIISTQMARIEGPVPVLAVIQFGAGTLLCVFFYLCSLVWIVATYRPGLDPNIIRTLHETAWLIFVMAAPGYTLQLVCIALCGFMDDSDAPWLPRWACYLNVWIGVGGVGGMLAVFFKSGPFAWNGLVGFWLPVILFVVWLCIMTPLLIAAIKRQATQPTMASPQNAGRLR